ncbi:MAG TPA: SPOR domain-containing protein [archaeon]|nr:SPOR domain-containing protein [archaeon]
MTNFLKYVTIRLSLGTFVAVFAVYGFLIWVHEVLYAGQPVDDYRLILWAYLAVLVVVSALMSLWGRWRFRRILAAEMEKVSAQYHPKTLVAAYHRLIRYLGSCYFFNTSRERLSRLVTRRLGGILLGMRIEDEEALAIYEKILLFDPENRTFYDFLVRAYSRKGRLSERSFGFIRRRYHERPDDRLVGVLAREYTLRRMLTFESERVFERCMKVYPEHAGKVLDFVIPRLLAFKRTDDNAALFYLEAFERGSKGKVLSMLGLIRERYREKLREDELALRVLKSLQGQSFAEDLPIGDVRVQDAPPFEKDRVEKTLQFPPLDQDKSDGTIFFERLDYDNRDEVEREKEGMEEEQSMSLESRFYGLVQRFFAGQRPTVGWTGKWLRPGLLVVLLVIFAYLSRPLIQRTLNSFKPDIKKDALTQKTEPSEPFLPYASGERFTIQVGAFSDSARAAALAEHLRIQGAEGRIIQAQSLGRQIFKVQVGLFDSDSAAAAAARALAGARLIREWQVVPSVNPRQ